MAITKADLLVFNEIETTDAVFGALKLPYTKPVAYIPNITYSPEHEVFVRGKGGMGSQLLIRELGKGSVKKIKATAAGGLDFTHLQTADTIRTILVDDVASKSEKVYEAVDAARQSATGAAKAELVFDAVLEAAQEYFSGYLTGTALQSVGTDVLTKDNFLDVLIEEMQKLDYRADILMVDKATYGVVLGFLTTGEFRANSREEVVRTGIVGNILGLDVVVDYNLDKDFVVYAKDRFNGATLLENFDVVGAKDFVGSLVRGMVISGGGGKTFTTQDIGTGAGIWGISYKGTA